MTRFRVATYNVHKCKGVDWRVSPDRVARVIGEMGADLLAVQEILHSQAEAISNQVGLPFTFGGARQHAGEPYGNAVFTRLPIASSESSDLTVRMREARQCLRVSVSLAAMQVHFFAVHFGTSYFERRQQARRFLSSEILERPDVKGTRIVAGDFNEWTSGLTTQLLSKHLGSAELGMHRSRKRTYPGLLPLLQLDHIYYDPLFHLSEMHLLRSRLALVASDHLPLFADFEV